MITLKALIHLEACKPGLRLFLKFFPTGKVSNKAFFKTLKENSAKLTKLRRNCLLWLAVGYPFLNFKERCRLIRYTKNPRTAAWNVLEYNHWLTADEQKQLKKMYDL